MMNRARPLSLLVVGSINMDLVVKTSRLPLEGESLVGETFSYVHGGKGANQAVALARLGATVTLLGKVGDDFHGVALREELAREGVDTGFVGFDKAVPTGFAVVLVDACASNAIVVFPGANDCVASADISKALASSGFDAVVLQFELPNQIVIDTCRLAREAGIPLIVDAGPARQFPLEEIPGVDVLSPNETEALALTGVEVRNLSDARVAAERILERSQAKAVVMKLGASGALLQFAGREAEHFPAQHVAAVDPTAAGDAFTSAMTYHFMSTGDLRESVAFANYVGAMATLKLGARGSLPTASEVDDFMKVSRSRGAIHV